MLFNAHALPAAPDEPHARVGNHLRVSHHPLLGLPVAPFIVHLARVENRKLLNTRNDAVFLDVNGQPILPPIEITPQTPVTIRLPYAVSTTCIWARVHAQPSTSEDGRPRPVPQPVPQPVLSPLVPRPMPRIPPISTPLPHRGLDLGRTDRLNLRPPLVCEAYVSSALGAAPVGRRSAPPYAFSAPGIIEIRVSGTGRVGGIEWIDGHDTQRLDFIPWAIMNLPHPGGLRYLGIADPMAHALARITAQAPKRLPLQDTVGAPSPAAAPAANAALERARVESLARELAVDLQRLINDPTPPLEQMIEETVTGPGGAPLASAAGDVSVAVMPRIARVQQLQLDPGTASLLGYKTLDDTSVEVEDRMVFYRVTGFFRDYPPVRGAARGALQALFDRELAAVPFAQRSLSRAALLERFVHLAARIRGISTLPPDQQSLAAENDYVMLEALAVADRLAPLDQLETPRITASNHTEWLPAVPPAAVREIETRLAHVRVAGLLAAGRRQPSVGSGRYEPINRANEDGYHLPIMLGLRSEDGIHEPPSEPGVGFIADRRVGPESLRTFVAQQDRFGRWSEWASAAAPDGPRPKPPRPQLQGYYAQPTVADAASRGGRITVHVAVPDTEALAPGSFPLEKVRVFAEDGRIGTVQTFEAAESTKQTFDGASVPPAERRFVVVLELDGPVLDRTEERRMVLTARWIDTAGQLSVVSEPHRLRMTDPRPPPQVAVPDVLQYSARPDVTGLAWVEHRWAPAPGQSRFGVYYTDENRLVSHLKANNETALLAQIENAADAAARASVFRAHQALFPDSLFERLRDVEVTFGSGEVGFRHALSGSLRVLSAYKIAAEASSGAKPVLGDLEMIFYGVPNADPPQRPTVAVRAAEPVPGEATFVAEVTITVVAGATIAATWRLSRTRADDADPRRIPVVATGPLSSPDPATGLQHAVYRDEGPVQIAPAARLVPWVRYTWVAEVQGAPESGSAAAGRAVPGRWSRASDPATFILVPPEAPVPLEFVRFTGVAAAGGFADLKIEVTHPETLTSGALGYFRLRTARRLPGGALQDLHEQDVTAAVPLVVQGVESAGEVVPVGTDYVLTLIDPIGRASDPLRATLI